MRVELVYGSLQHTVDGIRRGVITAETVVSDCLRRIDERETDVQAFAYLDRDGALASARRIDAMEERGPLAGVPLGVKDIIDTVDMPTAYGSEAYAGTRLPWDAPCVCLAKQAGAVVIGKTVSTEFAFVSPGKTRNPCNMAHTPGGSSSGSAAAVAAGMVLAAFATQTSGSLIRPAAFCGVVGYKPTFGLLNRGGVKVISDTLDTLGVMTRTVQDAAYLVSVLTSRPKFAEDTVPRNPKVGFFLGPNADQIGPGTAEALERARQSLRAKGATIVEWPTPSWFVELGSLLDQIMGWEATRSLAYERYCLADRITTITSRFLATMANVSLDEYLLARQRMEECATRLEEVWGDCDVLITPSAPGEAPAGLESTGSPIFNKSWTLLRAPTVHVPAGLGPQGLPVGVQLAGRPGDDIRTLSLAKFLEQALAATELTRATGV